MVLIAPICETASSDVMAALSCGLRRSARQQLRHLVYGFEFQDPFALCLKGLNILLQPGQGLDLFTSGKGSFLRGVGGGSACLFLKESMADIDVDAV